MVRFKTKPNRTIWIDKNLEPNELDIYFGLVWVFCPSLQTHLICGFSCNILYASSHSTFLSRHFLLLHVSSLITDTKIRNHQMVSLFCLFHSSHKMVLVSCLQLQSLSTFLRSRLDMDLVFVELATTCSKFTAIMYTCYESLAHTLSLTI